MMVSLFAQQAGRRYCTLHQTELVNRACGEKKKECKYRIHVRLLMTKKFTSISENVQPRDTWSKYLL